MIARIIKVRGDVQGVFFRHHARKVAQKLGISGWAKNEHDGSVTIFAQGGDSAVLKMQNWASQGSPMAAVEKIEVADASPDQNLEGFTVL